MPRVICWLIGHRYPARTVDHMIQSCPRCKGLNVYDKTYLDKIPTPYDEVAKMAYDKLSASEALIGFIAWITSLEKPMTGSAHHGAGVWTDLVDEFCKAHGLNDLRDGWEDELIYPDHIGFWKGEELEIGQIEPVIGLRFTDGR